MGFTHFLHLMNETHEKQVATRSDVKGYPTMLYSRPFMEPCIVRVCRTHQSSFPEYKTQT